MRNLYKNIYFANVCEGMPLKSKIFPGVSFRKILSFYYKRKRQLSYYEGTSSYIPLEIPERVNRVISQNFSELLLLKISQQTKTCSKLTKKECFRNVIRVSLWLAWRIFLKSVAEPDFRKSSGLYISNRDGALLLVKLQAFTVNDSERVNDRVCF